MNYNSLSVIKDASYVLNDNAEGSITLVNNTGAVVEPHYDSSIEATRNCSVTVEGGFFTGNYQGAENDVFAGEKIEVFAVIPEGKRFVRWHATGNAVFDDPESFATRLYINDGNVVIKAEFADVGLDSVFVVAIVFAVALVALVVAMLFKKRCVAKKQSNTKITL